MSIKRDIWFVVVIVLLSCFAPKKVTVAGAESPALFSTYWKLMELNGSPLGVTSKEPHLILNDADDRVTGNGGCNSFFGAFQHAEGRISFLNIGSTKMACPGLPVENEFFKVLQQTQGYTLKGDMLTLIAADGSMIASFIAVPDATLRK